MRRLVARGVSCPAVVLLAVFVSLGSRSATAQSYDLAVYGATVGGVATAFAASRQGLHVVLIEPTAHIGGMVSGGLSHTDIGDPSVIGGISREFFERVEKHYGEPLEWNFEPHVANQVFLEMVQEARVKLLLNSPLREKNGVRKRRGRIFGARQSDPRFYRRKSRSYDSLFPDAVDALSLGVV